MNSEIIRAITPLLLGVMGGAIAIVAILKSEAISADRFGLISNMAVGAITGAAGAATQSSGRSQITNSQIDKVDIDNDLM
jgi:hypothetical protein